MNNNENVEKKKEEYDPFANRDLKNGNSDIRSVANLIKSSLGSGLLAMPLAFSNAGWVLGLVSTFVISFICGHCIHVLVKVSRDCCKIERQPMLDYADTCESVFNNGPVRLRKFSKAFKILAEFATILTYLSICCVYTILIADSIKQLTDRYQPDNVLVVEVYCVILMVPLAIISQVRSLKWLAPFSLLANVLLFATFVICLYYVFSGEMDIAARKTVNDISRYPAFLSTVIFALEGVGIVMPTENSMKTPQHFLGCPSVLVVAMLVITLMYSALGLFGYFRFGDEVLGSITLNLPLDEVPSLAAKLCIILAVFFTYPLQFYVGMEILWKYLERWFPQKNINVSYGFMRALTVCAMGAIAVALPMLEQIIGIVGALFFSILGIVIPAILETVHYYERDLGRLNWKLWKNVVMLLFGVVAMTTGCAVALQDMVRIIAGE